MNKIPFKFSNENLSVSVFFRVSSKEHYSSSGPTSITAHTSNGVTHATVHSGGSYSYEFKRTCCVQFSNHSEKELQLAIDVKTVGNDGHLKGRDQIRLITARKGETVSAGITSWSHIEAIHVIDVEDNSIFMEIPFQAYVAQESVGGDENFNIFRSLNVLLGTLIFLLPGGILFMFLGMLGSHAFNPKVVPPSRRKTFLTGHKLLAASYTSVVLIEYFLGINHLNIWVYLVGVIFFGIAQSMIWDSRLKDGESYVET